MRVAFIHDLRAALPLNNRPIFFLHASVLLYFFLLPFNTFSTQLGPFTVKYTQAVFSLLAVFLLYAYWRKAITIRQAPLLYGFLALHIFAQFFSMMNAPIPIANYRVGVSVAIYGVLIFILVNAMRSLALLRSIFSIMGVSILVIVIHSFVIFLIQGGYFQTRLQPSLLGSGLAAYLAYFLIMYGVGLLHTTFKEEDREVRSFNWVLAALWMYIVILTGVKAAHIAMILLLIVLFIVLRGYRLRVAVLSTIFIALFLFQMQFGTVINLLNTMSVKSSNFDNIISSYITRTLTFFTLPSKDRVRLRPIFPSSRDSSVKEEDTAKATAAIAEFTQERRDDVEASQDRFPFPASSIDDFYQAPLPPLSKRRTQPKNTSFPVVEDIDFFAVRGSVPIFPDLEPMPVPAPAQLPSRPSLSKPSRDLLKQELVRQRWADAELTSSIEIRTRGILGGLYMGMTYPFTGVGPGQSGFFFNHYSEVVREKSRNPSYLWFLPETLRALWKNNRKWTIDVTNTHNIFLNAWAETGLFGLVAIIGILFAVFKRGIMRIWDIRHTRVLLPIHFALPIFIALLFMHQTLFLFVHPWLWSIIALTYVAADEGGVEKKAIQFQSVVS